MPRLIRFVIVGISNAILSFLVFQLLLLALSSKMHWAAGISQVVGYAAGVAWSFFWNQRWTFITTRHPNRQFARFVFLQTVLLVLTAGTIQGSVSILHIQPTLSWLLVMSIATLVNFIACRNWVFRKSKSSSEQIDYAEG